jgi:ketosteroid isomerase-like protein
MLIDDFLARLQRVTSTSDGWRALCPAHEDKNPSLSVGLGRNGQILVHCHAKCPPSAVVAKLGLTMADLNIDGPCQAFSRSNKRIVAAYDYRNADGTPSYQVCRMEPKGFRQRQPDASAPGRWVWNMHGVRPVLYRLPELLAAVKAGERIYVAEGEKDSNAIAERGAVATCNSGGAGKWRSDYNKVLTGADVVIIADKDEPGRRHAEQVAGALHGKAKSVRVIELPDLNDKPVKDAFDFFAAGGTLDQLRALGESKPEWQPPTSKPDTGTAAEETDDAVVARLAALSPLEYERQRQDAAEKLGCRRMSILDELVRAQRLEAGGSQPLGRALTFNDAEPWGEPVDGAQLLDSIANVIRTYIVAPTAAIVACALYVLHTYAFNLGDISPMLFITGPTKRCGKSRLLSLLARLCYRPLTASSASPAGIYRAIELYGPTVLIDEVDSFLKGDDQLRGLINSGHTRDAAFHLGCVASGDDFQPRRWTTWAPKILCGIGRLADTIEDRAVMVMMRRRRKDEPAERLHHRTSFDELRRKCARFVQDHENGIGSSDPAIPDSLNDRAADNWLPLLALADLAAGAWPDIARQAALELSGREDTKALGLGVELLLDIARTFSEANADRLKSTDLCERLVNMEGRPWAEYGKARRPISPNQLANLLRAFGLSPRCLCVGDSRPKGYLLSDFSDAFSRYLPENAIPNRYSATLPEDIGDLSSLATATPTAGSASQKTASTNNDASCSGVAAAHGLSAPGAVANRLRQGPSVQETVPNSPSGETGSAGGGATYV